MGLNPWVGWSLSTLALWFLNGNNSSADKYDYEPEKLSVTETKMGTPIPVIMGKVLLKSPLTIYYGDFRADKYTETYAAHAQFSAWPIILTLLLEWLMKPKTAVSVDKATNGDSKDKHTHPNLRVTGQATLSGQNVPSGEHGHDVKETEGPKYLMALATWLLSWLINGRNLKTTMQKGFKYYLGYQMLVCWSNQGMRIRKVYLGEKEVWSGDESREAHTPNPFTIHVNNDELFGGVDEGGGFIGDIRLYMGGSRQVADPWMQEQMNSSSVQEELRGLTPAYRPFVSVVVPTAYVGKQSTIPSMWLEMQFIPNRLGLGAIGEDANPAEVLYEIHVNDDWGLGRPPELLDVDALISIGKKLKEEKLGISVSIATKDEARTVIDAICNHLNIIRYEDPQTGKWVYKLIRDDYEVDKLVVLNQSNCSKITFNRLDWRETVSEVSVNYTDRAAQYEQSSINDNDPTIIELAEGNKVTKSYDFPYFTVAENALWVAKREAYQQGYPLATGSTVGDRTLYSIRTGDVVVLDWKPYGIKNLFVRVTDVDLGNFVDGEITIQYMEDVFGLGKAEYGFSGSTGWKTEDKFPTGVQEFRYMEFPYELVPDLETHVFAMAAKPDDINTVKWNIWRNKEPIGWTTTNSKTDWTPCGRLVYDYPQFTSSIDMVGIELVNIAGLEDLNSSTLANGGPDISAARNGNKILVIGNEMMAWSSITRSPSGNWQIRGLIRGIFDTVPQAHTSGEIAFFLEPQSYANVTSGGSVCLAGMTVAEFYNITTESQTVKEEFDNAKVVMLTTDRRAERPNPPGNVLMSYMRNAATKRYNAVASDLTIKWTPRNKVMQGFGAISQDDTVQYFTGEPFEAPEGAEYIVKVFVAANKVFEYVTEANEFVYTWANRCLHSSNISDDSTIEIATRLNGLQSYQSQIRKFSWATPTMVDACTSVEEVTSRMSEWANEGIITIPNGDYAETFTIGYEPFTIFIIGDECLETDIHAVLNYNGSYILPKQIVTVYGNTDLEVSDISAGFTFVSRYMAEASGGSRLYTYKDEG